MATWNIFLLLLISGLSVDAAVFTLSNRCMTAIWPGILAGVGKPQLVNGGFELRSGQSVNITAPSGWSGRFWARTGCSFDSSGHGNCITGDCGGVLRCSGAGGKPPASLAEFTLNSPLDYYDISLVDGFNLPVSILPSDNKKCKATKCNSDINKRSLSSLKEEWNGKVVACRSGCLAFNKPQFCCTGAYGSSNTCKPTVYSKLFKDACPTAYSYAFDDSSSTFTCNGANYLITFC